MEVFVALIFSWLAFKVWVVDWRVVTGRMASAMNDVAAESALRGDPGKGHGHVP